MACLTAIAVFVYIAILIRSYYVDLLFERFIYFALASSMDVISAI